MALFHQAVTTMQLEEYQDSETEAAKWNLAITDNIIFTPGLFLM